MSLERYSIGVDIDQSGINSGSEKMIETLNNATAKMKACMDQLADSVKTSMGKVTTTLTNGGTSTERLSASYQKMGESIATSTSTASDVIETSTQRMAASLRELQSSINDLNLKGMSSAAQGAADAHINLGNAMNKAANHTSIFSDQVRMLKQHLEWIATGVFLSALVAIPKAMLDAASETETLTQKLRQNLELADGYHSGAKNLDADLKQLTANAQVFAQGFGVSLTEVMDSMQILSRRFKDVESISYLTSVALTMNKLDFVDLKKASSDLEAVILQFGLTADGTRQFLNDFSVAVHTARITGTELMDALQRSGSSFHQFHMGTRESIAAIAALSTETARTGSTIGNTFKSVAANFSMDKAIHALDTYGIKLYEVNEQGMKVMRDGANVFQELQTLYDRLDDEGKSKLSLAIAGGKFQSNAMSAFLADANQNFTKLIEEMNNKSSNEMTKQLLQAGMDTYANKMAQFKASMQVLAQMIGSEMLPTLKAWAASLIAGTIWLQQHKEQIMEVLSYVKLAVEAYLAYKVAIIGWGAVMTIYTAIMEAYKLVQLAVNGAVVLGTESTLAFAIANGIATASAIASTVATEGLAAGLVALNVAMGPIGWLTIAIVALGVAIYEVYNNWQPILDWMRTTWNKVVNWIADHIGTIMALFPVLGAAIIVISATWEPIVTFVKQLWANLCSFLEGAKNVIVRIIDDVCTAFPKFVDSVKTALSNITSGLGTWAYNLLPQWGKDVLNFFGDLGTKLGNITKNIGNMIRNNLTLQAPGMGDLKKLEQEIVNGGNQSDPMAVANQLIEDMFNKAQANGSVNGGGGGGGSTEPDLNNQLESGNNKGKKGKSAYEIAKEEYQAEIADAELTAAEKLAIYQQYLKDVEKTYSEQLDYQKGLGKLEVADLKEQRAIKNAQLDLEIAEGKQKTLDYHQRKIALLQEEVENCKQGSVERIQAEIRVANAKTELAKLMAETSIQAIKQEENAQLERINTETAMAKKMKDLYQLTQEEYSRVLLIEENKRYAIQLDALTKEKAAWAGNEKEQEKIQTQITALYRTHTKTRIQLEQELWQKSHQYQLAALEGFRTGMTAVLQGLIHWNMTMRAMVLKLGQSILTNLGDVWIKGVVDRMSKGFAKMLGLTTQQTTQEAQQEQVKQESLTKVQEAGEKTRLLASKASASAAGAAGAAAATAMVGQISAAFTACLAMISAEAASIATILPSGPAIAAAIYAGVATSTGALTAAAATATSTIASFAVPSFDVGAWELGADTLAMVHKGETIIPAQEAQTFRNAVSDSTFSNAMSGTKSTGKDPDIHVHLSASAIDAKGVEAVLKKQGSVIGKIVKTQIRDYKTTLTSK